MKRGEKTGGFKRICMQFACNLHMICVIHSQEEIFELELPHCFPYVVACPFVSSVLPPHLPHARIQNSHI